MTSPIDPIRRAQRLRRAVRSPADEPEEVIENDDRNLPVPVGPVVRHRPHAAAETPASVFSAQLIGQDGQKRGLRGGPETLDNARTVYVRTEYSGPYDRRPPPGRHRKTEI